MYISQKNDAEKVFRYQSTYIQLTRLQSEIQGVIFLSYSEGKNSEYYTEFTNRYASLINQQDNHEDIDYQRAILHDEKEKVEKCNLAKIEEKKH